MKLHLPSGLRKALLACLAALALPTSLPSTVASASGIAAVLFFAGQETRADFRGPQGLDYGDPQIWEAEWQEEEGTYGDVRISDDAEVTLDSTHPGLEVDEEQVTPEGDRVQVKARPRNSMKYENVGDPHNLRINGTDGDVTTYTYGKLGDFKSIWFSGRGRHVINGGTNFSRSIQDIYVNTAQLVFDNIVARDLSTNFYIGSSTGHPDGTATGTGAIYVNVGADVATTGTLNVEEDAIIRFNGGALSFAAVAGEGKLTLAPVNNNGTGTFTLGGGILQALESAVGITFNLTGNLTLREASTINGVFNLTESDLILKGDITISATATFNFEGNLTLQGNNTIQGNLSLDADENLTLQGNSTIQGNLTLDQGSKLTLKEDSTISGNITGDGDIVLDKDGEITISSTGTNLQQLINRLTFAENVTVTTVTFDASGNNTVTLDAPEKLLSNYAFNAENTSLTLTQGGTFEHASVLRQLTVAAGTLTLKKDANLYLNRLDVRSTSLTLNADIYLETSGSIGCALGGDGKILLGDGAELTLGANDGESNYSGRIQLQEGASSATLVLTGTRTGGAEFDEGLNVRFDRAGEPADGKDPDINFTEAVTVRGDVEITDGTYVNFSETGDVKIDGELSGEGTLVFDRTGQTLTLGKGGSIGELQIKQGSAKIGGELSGDSLVLGAGVTLTFDEGGSFNKMEMTGSGSSNLLLGGDLEVGSLVDAPGKYSVKKADEKQTDPVHFVLRMEDRTELGKLTSVQALADEFMSGKHKGLTVGDGVGYGFATSGVIELRDGGTMERDFKFKGRERTGTLKLSDNRVPVEFQKRLTLEDAHVEMAGGTLSIVVGLILTGNNTLEVTGTTTNGNPYLTLGDGSDNFALSGDGTLDVNVSLSLLAGKTPDDINLIKNWKDAWKDRISFHVVFSGTEYGDASLDANGRLVWTDQDAFTGITYDKVGENKTGSITGNTVIGVTEDDIAGLTATEGANLKLVAGKDGIGGGGSVKADLSGFGSVYFTGTTGYFVENGWFEDKGPKTIYVRDTQLYFSGEKGNTADLTNLESNFVIGGSQHGAEDVGAAALALSKKVETGGSLTLKEDATIAFLLKDAGHVGMMSFGGKVDGSGKTLTLNVQDKREGASGGKAVFSFKGGGKLGALDIKGGGNLDVELGGKLEVGTLSGSLSSLTLGEKAELRVGNGDITLGTLSWEANTSLHLGSDQTISLQEVKMLGEGKLTIDLTRSVLDGKDGQVGFALFDMGSDFRNGKELTDYFLLAIDGEASIGSGSVDERGQHTWTWKVGDIELSIDEQGQLTWKSGYSVPPRIGPPTEGGKKLRYEVGSRVTTAGVWTHPEPGDIKHEVKLGAATGGGTNMLNFTFNEGLDEENPKRSNLWLEVLKGSQNFDLNIAGLKADTLLVRGEEGVSTWVTLREVNLGGSGDTSQTQWLGLKGLYVEGDLFLQIGQSFQNEGINTNLHLNTTTWDSVAGNASCSFYVGANYSFVTGGKLYVGYYDSTDDEETLKENTTGARLGLIGSMTVDFVKGTNMQLWGTGGLTLKNGGRLYGKLLLNGNSSLTVRTGVFEVEKADRVGSSSLTELRLEEEAEFRMNGGTLYVNTITMASNSRLQFTLHDETKDTALLELRDEFSQLKGNEEGEDFKARIVLFGGERGEDHYQLLFGATTTGQTWWANWYAKWQEKVVFEPGSPEMGSKKVKLSYDGKIHFVDDWDELTLTWQGSEKDAVLNWKPGGDAEWTEFDGSMSDWNKPERFERDARLTGASGGSYDVNLLEDVTTGDLRVEGGATFTLQRQGGRELDVQGLLSTTAGSTLAIGEGVTVKPLHYVGEGSIQLLNGGTLDLRSCIADSLTLSLVVGEKEGDTVALRAAENQDNINLDSISGEGNLVVNGSNVTLHFINGGQVGSLREMSEVQHLNLTVSGPLEFLRKSAIGGVVTFNDGASVTMGGDLSVGLLRGGVLSDLVNVVIDSGEGASAPLTLKLTGGDSTDYVNNDKDPWNTNAAPSSYYWGNFTLGSAEGKKINLEVDLHRSNRRQGFGKGVVTIWGDMTLKSGILEFYSDEVVVYGKVDAESGNASILSLCGVKSFTIDGEEGEAGYVHTLSFSNDSPATGGAGSALALGGDLEVENIAYVGEGSSRARHRIERAADVTETVYLLLRNSDAVNQAETLQDYLNEYRACDEGGTTYTGVDLRQGTGIGWAGEGELQLKGDGGTFTTPFKLKKGSLCWTGGTQTMSDFTAAEGTKLAISSGHLALEQFHGGLDTLTLEKGSTLSITYGTLKAQTLRTVDATLGVNISDDRARLSFSGIEGFEEGSQGSLQLQLTGWNELGDQTVGYQLFDNEDSQWGTLWNALDGNWEGILTFLDDAGTEINSMVELTKDGVVRLRLEDGDLYWGATDDSPLLWSGEGTWHSKKGGGDGDVMTSFKNGNRVHLEAHEEDDAKTVTLGSNVIAGSMDVQGKYTLTKNTATSYTLTVQKELTVGGKGTLTVNKGNRLVVKDYVNIEKDGSIALATDMVIGGNIGGGGGVENADGDDGKVVYYVLWDNGGNGEITWKGYSWDTYVDGVLGGDRIGYGKTGKTDLSIVGAASLGRNFKGEQGKTVFTEGLTLNGYTLVVGEGARIIVEGSDGLKSGVENGMIHLGYAEGGTEKGTIEITVEGELSRVQSDERAELHVTVEGEKATLSGVTLDGGLVLDSGTKVTLSGENSIDNMDAEGLRGLVVVAEGEGSTTTLRGNVDIVNGLQVDGVISGSSYIDVRGGLRGKGRLEAQTLTLTYGKEGSVSYRYDNNKTISDGTTYAGTLKLDTLTIHGNGEIIEDSGRISQGPGQIFTSSIEAGNLGIDGGILHLRGGQLKAGNVSTFNEGRLVLEYGGKLKLDFTSIDDSNGKLKLTLVGFSEDLVEGDGYDLFDDSGWNKGFWDKIQVTGWTEDGPEINPKKLVLDKKTGNVKIYSPADDPILENAPGEGIQALVGNRDEPYAWSNNSGGWVHDISGTGGTFTFAQARMTVFAGSSNKEITIQVNSTVSATGGMCVLLGEEGLGGKYLFDMTGGGLTVGGNGLVIGEDTQVRFSLGGTTSFTASRTTVKSGAKLEILEGEEVKELSKNFGAVRIEDGGEVVIYQPGNWSAETQFRGDGKLTVDLSQYEGSRNFSSTFTDRLFYHDETRPLKTFELKGAFIHIAWNDNMRALRSIKNVVIGKGACLLLDLNGTGSHGWGGTNGQNVNIHLQGTGCEGTESAPATPDDAAVANDAAFSFYTNDPHNGDASTAETVKTPWGFTLDDDATMRIGRDDGEKEALEHTLQLGGTFDGKGHTLTKIGAGVLEFGFGCTVEDGSTGKILVNDGTLKLSYAGSSTDDDNLKENDDGLKNYAVDVRKGKLDMGNRNHSLGSLDIVSDAEVLNMRDTIVTICGYGDDEAENRFGQPHTADNAGLGGTSWVMDWEDGEQTVKNAGSLNEVEVNDGILVLDGVSTVEAAAVNGGTLELKGIVTIKTALEADGGELVADGSLTLNDGMNGTLDKLTINGGSGDTIELGGKGEKVLRAKEVAATGGAAIQIDISGKTETQVRLDFGAINGTLHLKLTGYDDPTISEYQLFVNNNQHRNLWANAWWEDVLDIEVSGTAWNDGMELELTEDGVLHFLPFDGLTWNGTDPDNNVWRDNDPDPWSASGGKDVPAGQHVQFTDTDADGRSHEGTVQLDGMVTPKKVTVRSGDYVFKQYEETTGGLNIVQVGAEDDPSSVEAGSGALVVGGDKNKEAHLTLALKNTSIPEIQLKENGTLVLADDGALTDEDKVRGYKKTKLRFMGGTLDYSAYDGKTLTNPDVSDYVAGANDEDRPSTAAAKVHVSGEDYAEGVMWGKADVAPNSGVSLALDKGLDKSGDGLFTLAWQDDGTKEHKGTITVEESKLILDVTTNPANKSAQLTGGAKVAKDAELELKVGTGQLAMQDVTGEGMLTVSTGKVILSGTNDVAGITLAERTTTTISGENALGGADTTLTLLNSATIASGGTAKAQAGTVIAAGDITVDGNITFTGKVEVGTGSSFTAAAGKTAGFSGDISEYKGTLKTKDGSGKWHMTDNAATGRVQAGLEGNGTFDFEVKDPFTLQVHDGGMIGTDGDQLTLRNSGAGNLIVASGTEQDGVKLDAGERNGKITLGMSENNANDSITWKGTNLVQGDIVLANVILGEGGFTNRGSAKIYVNTSVSPDKRQGGKVDVGGMAAENLRDITVNEHGQLTGVTGTYTVGRDPHREHYGLTLHFTEENERNSGNTALIQGRDGNFTLDLSKAGDDLQFVFDASIIRELRAKDAEKEEKHLQLHLLGNGTIKGAPKEVKLEDMKDQIAQLLWSIDATIVQDSNDWYLQLVGSTSNLYVVMDGKYSDLATVEDMVLFEGTDATAVMDGKTLTLNYDGKEKGEGDVTLHNLVGTEGTTLDLNNTGSGDDERLNVVLDNTHYGDAFNNNDEKRPLTGLTEEEKSQLHGQDTTFQGKILGGVGVDITKEGKGTLTVGDDYELDGGDTTINHGQLVLQGDENKMGKLVFNYTDEPDTLAPTPGHQGEGYGNVNPEERGLVLDGGAEGSKTTIDSIEERGSNSNDNRVELDNAELVLTGESNLKSTTITGNEEKGGTVTVQGSGAVTFDGGRNPRMEGVDVNVKDGGSLTLTGGAGMDVGDVTLSGKQGSSLDIGKGTTMVDSLTGDANSTLKSDDEYGKLSVREGGSFFGKLESSSPDSKAGTLVVEDGADFTLDNVTTTTDPTKAWDIQVGSNSETPGGSNFTVDTSKGGNVTFGDVKLGTGNTTTFVVDPKRKASDPPALKGNSLNWGKDSTLVLKGDGVYPSESNSLTLGSFNEELKSNLDDLKVDLQGSAFFLKDEEKTKVERSADGKGLTVQFENAEGNKFERLLPNMSKNADAGASMVWDSLKEKDSEDALMGLLRDPSSDYAKMANGLIAMYDNGDKENLEKALAAVAGASISTLGPALVQDLHRQLGAIRNRTTTMADEVSYDSYDKLPAWHAWLNAEGNYHKMDSDGFAPGYTLNNWGGTVGADVDVSPATTVGFALTAMYGDLKPDASDAATGDLDTTYLSAFARTTKGAWIHTFVVSAGMADVSLDRTVNVGGASYRTQGSTDGYAVGAMYEVGYTKLVNRKGTIALQPVFNVEIRHAAIKGYTETGSDAGLKVDDIEQDVVTFGIGARMQSIVGENFYNRTSILEARLLLKADVGDSTGVSSNSLIGSAAVGEVESAEIGAFGVEAGVGLTVPLGSSRGSVFMDASAEVRSGWTSFNATLGYRINF